MCSIPGSPKPSRAAQKVAQTSQTIKIIGKLEKPKVFQCFPQKSLKTYVFSNFFQFFPMIFQFLLRFFQFFQLFDGFEVLELPPDPRPMTWPRSLAPRPQNHQIIGKIGKTLLKIGKSLEKIGKN